MLCGGATSCLPSFVWLPCVIVVHSTRFVWWCSPLSLRLLVFRRMSSRSFSLAVFSRQIIHLSPDRVSYSWWFQWHLKAVLDSLAILVEPRVEQDWCTVNIADDGPFIGDGHLGRSLHRPFVCAPLEDVSSTVAQVVISDFYNVHRSFSCGCRSEVRSGPP